MGSFPTVPVAKEEQTVLFMFTQRQDEHPAKNIQEIPVNKHSPDKLFLASTLCLEYVQTHKGHTRAHICMARTECTHRDTDGSPLITEKHIYPGIKVYEPSVVTTPLQSGFALFTSSTCTAQLSSHFLALVRKVVFCLSARCFCVCV